MKRTHIIICGIIIISILVISGLLLYFSIKTNNEMSLSVNDKTINRINEIRSTSNTNTKTISGKIYYISNDGDDNADGKTPQTAWKTLSKLQSEFVDTIQSGDCVLFNRGDEFRGNITISKNNILLGSYGDESKQKPIINVSPYDASVEGDWTCVEENIWMFSEIIKEDVGAIWFFKDDDSLSNKQYFSDYSYEVGQKISFDESFNEENLILSDVLNNELEFYHSGKASSGDNTGKYVYVYSKINPKLKYDKIEFAVGINGIYGKTNLVVDNLKIIFAGNHGIGTGTVANLTVTNCEFGYIGGSRQNQNNVRFGNAIEIYGQVKETDGCEVNDGFVVNNNFIYEVYDAGITFQNTANQSNSIIEKANISNNVVERCNYSIEYWNISKSTLQDKQSSYIKSFFIKNNILRYSGCGVSQTRTDKGQSAHIKTWVHDSEFENKVVDTYQIENNTFYMSSEQMLAIYACDDESMPKLKNNVFYNEVNIPLGYVYNKNISKKIIPYVRSKMSKLFSNNEFNYLKDFEEKVLFGTSKDVLWELNIESGILNIDGYGEMDDYTLDTLPEWCNYGYFVNEIIIGCNVTKLGTYAFYELQYVEKIQINCKKLQNLSYDPINFNNGDNYTFYKTGKKWYGIIVQFGENVENIPSFLFWPSGTSNEAPYIVEIQYSGNKIIDIGNHALSGLSCQEINLPEGLKSLGVLAISNSPTLKKIILPDSLVTLSSWCFAGNYYLESVVIGENIHSLESNLFYSDVNLKQIIIKGDLYEDANITNIFSSDAKDITLYGNKTVEDFVKKYNLNNTTHQLKYSINSEL